MILLLLHLWLAPSITQAEILLGHNLTPTTNVLDQGQWSLGSYAAAYGITDHLMVGTCPWLMVNYNMPLISMKYDIETGDFIQRVQVEQMFLKTFDYGLDAAHYYQTSSWTRFTATRKFNGTYGVHANLGIQYFWEDKMPYSMRPIPTNHTPLTLSVSNLQEIHFDKNFGMFVESGLLGFNYPNRYLHLGLSGFYQWDGGYVQLGLSRSFPIGPEYIQANQFTILQNSEQVWSSVYHLHPSPYHPEIQIQIVL